MDFGWTKEEQMWRKAVHDFAQKKIAPRTREIDDNSHIPEDIIEAMADMGLWAPTVAEEYGGQGMSVTMATIAAEELGRAEISLALPVMYLVQASWGFVFDRYASAELKREILPAVTAGKAFLGIASTEPGGGSDIEGVTRCTGQRQPDGNWVLNGEKLYISGIKEAQRMGGAYMTLVRTDPDAGHKGFSFFAVDIKDNPQVSTTLIHNWGRTGISTGGFNMQEMPLADRYLIGEEGRGFYYAMEGYTYARALIGATCCGAAETALKLGVDYIRQRKSFGKPLAAYQGINFPAAERYTDIESARLLTYKAAWMADQMYSKGAFKPKDTALFGAMAKLRAPIMAFETFNEVANWLGAMGYTKEYPIEMGIRGVRSYSIGAEGGMNIMRMIIARELIGNEYTNPRR
ncbi:MAG: Acyl-CoA dehydrogenase [Chloroflexi bacterium ADurb.Bin325]|nr:MAG: Acyl-CoA dehydrogenase [Chloroflexi bacterium ADurb.Bin325]